MFWYQLIPLVSSKDLHFFMPILLGVAKCVALPRDQRNFWWILSIGLSWKASTRRHFWHVSVTANVSITHWYGRIGWFFSVMITEHIDATAPWNSRELLFQSAIHVFVCSVYSARQLEADVNGHCTLRWKLQTFDRWTSWDSTLVALFSRKLANPPNKVVFIPL